MADNTRASWDAFLFELRGTVWELFPQEAVFMAELSGVGDGGPNKVRRIDRVSAANRDIFSGRHVRHTVILAGLPGGGFVSETGTWNVPHQLPSDEVIIKLVRALVPFSVTVDVERDSMDNSNASAVAQLVEQAYKALAKMENIGMLGDGTGLVANVTSATGSPGLTVPVGTNANFDILLPGTVWDVLTRSSGANPGNGLRRKIASVDEAAGTVTFDTAQQASDGNSGSITFSANEGIYLPGSWSNGSGDQAPGALCVQGLEQAAAATGTFESIDKATVTQWQGIDGRAGDTTVVALSDQLLDAAVRRGRRSGLGAWDFGLADPAVVDLYKQGKLSQVRYAPQESVLKSGFRGIVYDGADRPFPLIKEPAMKKQAARLIDKASFTLYGDRPGPDFLEDDGGMFRRFARSLPKEAELLDRFQMGVTRCNTIVKLDNLATAS